MAKMKKIIEKIIEKKITNNNVYYKVKYKGKNKYQWKNINYFAENFLHIIQYELKNIKKSNKHIKRKIFKPTLRCKSKKSSDVNVKNNHENKMNDEKILLNNNVKIIEKKEDYALKGIDINNNKEENKAERIIFEDNDANDKNNNKFKSTEGVLSQKNKSNQNNRDDTYTIENICAVNFDKNEILYIGNKRNNDGTLSPVYLSLKDIIKSERYSELLLEFFLSKCIFFK